MICERHCYNDCRECFPRPSHPPRARCTSKSPFTIRQCQLTAPHEGQLHSREGGAETWDDVPFKVEKIKTWDDICGWPCQEHDDCDRPCVHDVMHDGRHACKNHV